MPADHNTTKTAAMAWADQYEHDHKAGKHAPGATKPDLAPLSPLCGPLMDKWAAQLTNRSADDDRSRLKIMIAPFFKGRRIADVKLSTVMEWIDAQRAATKTIAVKADDGKETKEQVTRFKEPTIRHGLNLLSRFFGWAVERDYMQVNPVRMISQGSRPKQTAKSDRPWLEDDMLVRRLFNALLSPVDLMFYLGNRAGLRLGELAGLRLCDLDWTHEAEPVLRVMYQYDGEPLKEDKPGQPKKVKWPPVPPDAVALLDQVRAAREGQGAAPEDLLWPCPGRETDDGKERCYRKEYIEQCWEKAVAKLAAKLPAVADQTFYTATRHSFISRNLKLGVALQIVSEAVGHSSPAVTQRFYNHFVRKEYPDAMRTGLQLRAKEPIAPVLRLPKKPRRHSAEFSARVDIAPMPRKKKARNL